MAGAPAQAAAEARAALAELSSGGLDALNDLVRVAHGVVDRFNDAFGRIDALLDQASQPPSLEPEPPVQVPVAAASEELAAVPEPEPPPVPSESVALPLLLDFAERSRALQSRRDLTSLFTSSAARLAPRVMLFARRGVELVGWDGFVGDRRVPDLRGAKLSLGELRDLAESLDQG